MELTKERKLTAINEAIKAYDKVQPKSKEEMIEKTKNLLALIHIKENIKNEKD